MDKPLFDLYTDYLIASFDQTTATGLSRLVDGAVSHDQVTRFLAASKKEAAELWKHVKPFVRHIEHEAGDEAVLVIDDTIVEKPYTDENAIIAWHYDHTKGRSVKGLNLITTLYVADYQGQTLSVPVSFVVVEKTDYYTDEKTGKNRRRSPTTKNEHMRQMLTASLKNQIGFRYVLADIFYASAENMRFIKLDLKREFVLPIKSNRKVARSIDEKQQGRFQTVESLALAPDCPIEVHLEGVPFPVHLMRQVFENEDGSRGERYLVTSDTTLTSDEIATIYKRRWKVEEYHKSVKQNAALAKSPTRRETTQMNHLLCSLVAFVKLEQLKVTTSKNHFAMKAKLYLKALRSAFDELQQLRQGELRISLSA